MGGDKEFSKGDADREKAEKSRRYSLKDSASFNTAIGFGDNYISAYGVALNASPAIIGMLTSIPNLIAPMAQLATSRAMEKNSRKKIFSIAILLQALSWLPIISVSFLFLKNISWAPVLLVIFYTMYAIFGNFATPAWVSWIGDLINPKEAGKFLGLRNRIGGITGLVAIVLGGIMLNAFSCQAAYASKPYILLAGFGLIFLLAMTFRLLSRHFVLKQYEPTFHLEKDKYFSFSQFVKKIPKSNFGKFSLYVALILLATNIVGPYYSLYMLRDLKFSYLEYMLVTVFAGVSTFVFISLWGKFADRHGNIQMLKITSALIPILCFLWPAAIYFIPNPYKFPTILLAQFISGYAWAGFNMSAGNFVFEAATPQRRGLCSAYSNMLNGIGIFIGVTIGSVLISYVNVKFMNIIMLVSIISGVLRYIIFLLMVNSIKEIREVKKAHWQMVPMISNLLDLQEFITNGILLRYRNHKKVDISSDMPLLGRDAPPR